MVNVIATAQQICDNRFLDGLHWADTGSRHSIHHGFPVPPMFLLAGWFSVTRHVW